MGKRALTTAVAAATMLWSVGFSSFVAPLTAHAATAGDVIKGQTLSTVYYYGSDGKRYAFPNQNTYFSWYSDFSGVQTISDSELAAIPLGGNIMQRPGSFWVKIQSDPKTYAVSSNGVLNWIETEDVATGLAGANWNHFINDVPDVFFADYTVGAPLSSAAAAYNGALVMDSSSNYYVIQNGEKRLVTSAGFTANRFQSRNALTGTGIDLSAIPSGTQVTAYEAGLSDTAQLPAAATGGLTASTASDTPVSATLPASAASVPLFSFNLSANSGSATVSQVTVNMGGVGNTADFDNVYLYQGLTRLTNGRSVNSSSRQVTFGGLNISLTSGQTAEFTVRGDVADSGTVTAGDTANFSLASASAIVSSATLSGSFPIVSNSFGFSTTSAGTITIAKNGTVSNPTLGEQNAQIAKFSLSPESEDASVQFINLEIDRASDHSNFQLWNGSTLLSTGVVTNDYVAFTLTSPLVISQGNQDDLTVTANIGGRSGDTIVAALDQNTDIIAMGSKYGFNLGVVNNYADTSSACTGVGDSNCSYSTIQGGKLTFAFNGPIASNIQIDSTQQDLLNFALTAANYTELDQLVVELDCTVGGSGCSADGLINSDGSDLNLQNITIRNADGSSFMGPNDLSASGSQATQDVTFKDTQDLQAGQSLNLMVTADVFSQALANNVYVASLLMGTSNVKAKDNNGDSLASTDIVPSANLVGNQMTLTASSVSVSASAPPSNSTYVIGATSVPVVGYSFQAGDSSSATVTDLTVNVAGDADGSYGGTMTTNADNITVQNHVSSCALYDSQSGAQVATPESPTSDSPAIMNFDNFNWTVAAGSTGKLIVQCNFANTAISGVHQDDYSFYIPGASSITAQDATGKTVTAAAPTFSLSSATAVPDITIVSAGSMTVSQDGSTPKSTIVLGSSTAVPVSAFKFQASSDNFVVDTLSLGNCVGTNGCLTTVQPITTYSNTGEEITVSVGSVSQTFTEGGGAAPQFSCNTSAVVCGGDLAAAINTSAGNAVAPYVTASVNGSGLVTLKQVAGPGLLSAALTSGADYTVVTPTPGNDAAISNVYLNYQDANGNSVVKQGSFASGYVKFSGLNLPVSNQSVKTVTVTVDTNSVSSTSGATSGTSFQVNLIPSDFKAYSSGSNGTLTAASVSEVDANQMTIRKTVPTITLAAGSPSGTGAPGKAALFNFTVAADSRGFVDMDSILFRFTSTDNAGTHWNTTDVGGMAESSKWTLYNTTDTSSALGTPTFYEANGTTVTEGGTSHTPIAYVGFAFTLPKEEISAGSSKTYTVWVDTSGASSSQNDVVRLDIPAQTDVNGLGTPLNALTWDDDVQATYGVGTDGPSTIADGTVTNGALVKSLPVTGGTVQY